jgi:hypothetical protein
MKQMWPISAVPQLLIQPGSVTASGERPKVFHYGDAKASSHVARHTLRHFSAILVLKKRSIEAILGY